MSTAGPERDNTAAAHATVRESVWAQLLVQVAQLLLLAQPPPTQPPTQLPPVLERQGMHGLIGRYLRMPLVEDSLQYWSTGLTLRHDLQYALLLQGRLPEQVVHPPDDEEPMPELPPLDPL